MSIFFSPEQCDHHGPPPTHKDVRDRLLINRSVVCCLWGEDFAKLSRRRSTIS